MSLDNTAVILFIDTITASLSEDASIELLQNKVAKMPRLKTLKILDACINEAELLNLKDILKLDLKKLKKIKAGAIADIKNPTVLEILVTLNKKHSTKFAQISDFLQIEYCKEYGLSHFFREINNFILAKTNSYRLKIWLSSFLYKDNKTRAEVEPIMNTNVQHLNIKPHLETLLINLGFSADERKDYFSRTITTYEIFQELRQNGFIQVDYVLRLLEKKPNNKKVILIITALLGSYLLTALLFPSVLSYLVLTLANPLTLPILGVILTTIILFFALNAIFNAKILQISRVRNFIFSLTNAVFNYTGYILWLGAGTVMTPLIALCFLAASLVDVVKECICLIHERIRYQPYRDSENKREHIQRSFNYIKHRNAFLVGVFAASLLVAIMLGWCLLTGIWVTPTAIVTIIIIYVVKATLIAHNGKIVRHSLQRKLENLTKKDSEPCKENEDQRTQDSTESLTTDTPLTGATDCMPKKKPTIVRPSRYSFHTNAYSKAKDVLSPLPTMS